MDFLWKEGYFENGSLEFNFKNGNFKKEVRNLCFQLYKMLTITIVASMYPLLRYSHSKLTFPITFILILIGGGFGTLKR